MGPALVRAPYIKVREWPLRWQEMEMVIDSLTSLREQEEVGGDMISASLLLQTEATVLLPLAFPFSPSSHPE